MNTHLHSATDPISTTAAAIFTDIYVLFLKLSDVAISTTGTTTSIIFIIISVVVNYCFCCYSC